MKENGSSRDSMYWYKNSNTLKSSNLFDSEKKYYKPESSHSKRIPPDKLAIKLMEYDVVSFDIFDTLILRPFMSPLDVFLLLSCKYKETNFNSIRLLSDKEARLEKYEKQHTFEVNIYDIYIKLAEYINIDPIKGAEIEMALEMDICFANPYMKLVYDILCQNNKKIIAISNMYMPTNWMRELLCKCGYSNMAEVFVSCDYCVDKKSSELFKIAELKMSPNKRFIHVGDSNQADIVGAKKAGWDSYHYPSVNFYGGMHRPKIIETRNPGLSPLIGSVYNGIVNAHLHNGLTQENDYYEYGYKSGGPFAVGFATWIHDICKRNNIDKILFTARDGYTIKLVYDRLFNDIPCEYAFWSRSIASRISVKYMPHYFKQSLLYEMRAHKFEYKVIDQLNYFKIPHLVSKLPQYDLSPETLIGTKYIKQYEKFIKFITDNIEEVKQALSGEENATREYYRYLLKTSKKVAAVDIGWSGMNINVMKNIIETDWKPDCSVMGLLGVMHPGLARCNPAQLLTNDQQVYMFSSISNTNEMDFVNKGSNYLPFFYEILSGAPHSSIYRIEYNKKDEIQFVFDIPRVENYWIYKEIRRGMLDFCDQYTNRFKNYKFMFRIPGSDTAMIIRKELENSEYMKTIFGDMSYNLGRLMPAFEQNVSKVKHFIK